MSIERLRLNGEGGSTSKVVEGTDLGDFPPHLIPLIKVLDQVSKEGGIDLKEQGFKGLTITFHK